MQALPRAAAAEVKAAELLRYSMSAVQGIRGEVQPQTGLHRVLGPLLVVASIAYFVYFIPRGWVPHDEGMIGQSAERVMNGEIPHVDYEEPYTGGLTFLYAAIFEIFGVHLLYVRYALFAGAAVAQLFVYLILRRFLGAAGAGVGAVLSAAWSFPNYFAGLPSWWVLICALVSLWSYIRYVETSRLRYIALAGVAVGLSVLFKQTGVYLIVALALSLLHDGTRSNTTDVPRAANLLAAAAAAAAALFAVFILRSRVMPAETVFLLLPVLACSAVLLIGGTWSQHGIWATLRAPMLFITCALATIAVFVLPYVARHELAQLVNGLVLLPQRRLEFASRNMPRVEVILLGLPLLAAVAPFPGTAELRVRRAAQIRLVIIGAAIAIATLYYPTVYFVVWHGARALAALIPLAVSAFLISRMPLHPDRRRVLFALSSMLAWTSMVQFPFSAPIYFCYVTPLVILAAAALGATRPDTFRRPAFAGVLTVMLMFAVLAMNQGYVFNLGVQHKRQYFDTDLRLGRAEFKMNVTEAAIYRNVVGQVQRRLHGGRLVAGPDAPEVYFLTGQFSPTGSIFDFFSNSGSGIPDQWRDATVVVLNHNAGFSHALSEETVAEVRRRFPRGESNGRLDVRWR